MMIVKWLSVPGRLSGILIGLQGATILLLLLMYFGLGRSIKIVGWGVDGAETAAQSAWSIINQIATGQKRVKCEP